MAYRISKIDENVWKEKIQDYTYALLYEISQIKLCRIDELSELEEEQLLEARFFSTQGELHVYEGEEGREIVEIQDDGMDEEQMMILSYQLDRKFQGYGKQMDVKEYLMYDEDGQMYVGLTRLCDIR